MSAIKKLLSATVLYGMSSIIGRLLNYILVPIHTSVFNPEDYGLISDFFAQIAVLNILYTYGMETTFFKFSQDKTKNEKEVYQSLQTLLLGTSTLFSIIIIVFSTHISNILGYSNRDYLVQWIAIILWIDTVSTLPFAKLRLENKALKFASIRITSILINVIFNIIFLYIFRLSAEHNSIIPSFIPSSLYNPSYGPAYVFLATLLGNGIYLIFLFKYTFIIKPQLNLRQWLESLKYSIPLLFAGLAYTINEVADRSMLKYFLPDNFYPGRSSLYAMGVYSACYKLSIIVSLGVQAFRYAAEPFFFKEANQDKSPQLFADIIYYFSLCLALLSAFVLLNIDIFKHFITKKIYWEGLGIVPFLLLANVFLGIYNQMSIWYKLTNKTTYGMYISIIGAIITIIGNIILIPILGYMGSAIVTSICYFSIATISYIYGQKYYRIPYPILKMLLYIILCFTIGWGSWFFKFDTMFYQIVFQNIIFILLIALVYIFEIRSKLRKI